MFHQGRNVHGETAANWSKASSKGGIILANSGKIGPPIVSDMENRVIPPG